jgi:CheY-like chemotaxis protein
MASNTLPEQPGTPAADRASKRILIVDDDEVTRKVTEWKLQTAGYRVSTAADGSQAIEVICDLKPELVLLDINFPPDVPNGGMPAWDGFRLMMWLRSVTNLAAKRFIVITSGVPSDFEERIRASGVAGYFQKPLRYNLLLEMIEKQLQVLAE